MLDSKYIIISLRNYFKIRVELKNDFIMKLVMLLNFILMFRFDAYAQKEIKSNNRVVAEAGIYKITAEEFENRYEFSPHPRTTKSIDSALDKKEYLYTLIAEKLLAQKSKSLKLDTIKDVRDQLNHLKNLFVRDALYKKEVTNKVKISPKEIDEAVNRSSEILLVKYLYSTDKNEILNLYSSLKNGTSLDSLLVGRHEEEEQKTLGKIQYGTLDGYVEDSLYNIKPGQITSPIYTGNRWYIFKLYQILKQPFFNTSENIERLKNTIVSQQTNKLEKDYLFNFLRKFSINVDRYLFTNIYDEVQKYLKAKRADYTNNNGSKSIDLLPNDIDKIENTLGQNVLNSNFVKFEDDPITTKQFLENLKYANLKIDTSNINDFAVILNGIVKNYIESELLVKEGFKLGLENSIDVSNDLSLWESYYLSQVLQKVIYDSVVISDAQALDFFNKNHEKIYKPEEVNLEEIITNDLDEISKALNEINNGLSFNEAAEKYCIVDSIKQRGGELGYLPVNKLGELGEISEKMKPGDVYGPIKVNENYVLIKLIDMRKPDHPQDTSFVKNKDDIIEAMKKIQFADKLKNYVANLAVDYGLKINQDVFTSISVSNINTVTYRMIGFGGRILAFPYSPSFAKWYYEYKNMENKLVQ